MIVNTENLHRKIVAAYKKGFIDATTQFAVWKDGVQVVGIMQDALGRVIEQIETEGYYSPPKEAGDGEDVDG